MRGAAARLLACCALGATTVAGGAGAAQPPPALAHGRESPSAAADVPSGDGTVLGRIVHPQGPQAAAGLPVVLYALPAGGEPGVRSAEADADGRFRFEKLSSDPSTAWLVGTRHAGVPFGARFAFAPGEREHRVEIAISDPTDDVGRVRRGAVELRIERSCAGLRVHETHALHNTGSRIVYVPAERRGDRAALLDDALPESARDFEAPFAVAASDLEREDRRVRYWGPLFPGEQSVSYAYTLPQAGDGVALRRRFPAGAERVWVLTPASAPPPEVEGGDLAPAPERTLEGTRYRALAGEGLAGGAELALRIAWPQDDADEIAIDEARLWLELDGAALTVDEQYRLAVAGDAPLQARGGAPLLCLPLPAGAGGLRFSPAALDLGLAPDASGGLAIRGPVPPGTTQLALGYRVPADGGAQVFRRRFPREVPLLSLMVADTGLLLESERLHARRPLRTADRNYLHLEGFGIAPAEEVSLRLVPLAPRGSRSPRLAAGLVGLLALGCCALLVAPLRGREGATAPAAAAGGAAVEREALYAAIRDLDDDLDTGKLAPEDHAALRAELRARAVALLAEERDARKSAGQTTAPAPAAACPACSAPRRAGDRFCPQCGARLADAGAGA